MTKKSSGRIPDFIWRLMRPFNRRMSRNYKDGARTGELILLLTTTGRKSGLPRVTPLQYEELQGVYYVGSARGEDADWYRNILADPRVEVQVKAHRFYGRAEVINDVKDVADFLQLRLDRRPKMIGAIMRLEGLPRDFERADLEAFAADKAVIAIHAEQEVD
jgi:deazaflavin-dependent oxidoreductase (nitroreductase family)